MHLPYLELPLAIGYGTDNTYPDKVVKVKLIPTTITAYHEGYFGAVFVYCNQQIFQLDMTIEQFEMALVSYYKQIDSVASIKSKLKLVN